MFYQAPVNGKAAAPEPVATPEMVTEHASSLASDLITLAELQARLLRVDAGEAAQKSAWSIVFLAMFVATIIGSVPVLMLGLSELIIEQLAWSRAWTYLAVSLFALILSVLFGAWAALRIQKITAVFSRSIREFQSNLEFVKSLLQTPSAPPPRSPSRF